MRKMILVSSLLVCISFVLMSISSFAIEKNGSKAKEITTKIDEFILGLNQIAFDGNIGQTLETHNRSLVEYLAQAAIEPSLTKTDRMGLATKLAGYLEQRKSLDTDLKRRIASVTGDIVSNMFNSRRALLSWLDYLNGKISRSEASRVSTQMLQLMSTKTNEPVQQ